MGKWNTKGKLYVSFSVVHLILWLVNRLVPELLFHVNHILLVLYKKIMALSVQRMLSREVGRTNLNRSHFTSLRSEESENRLAWNVSMSRCQLDKDHPVVIPCFLFFFFCNDWPGLSRLYYCFGQPDAHQTEGLTQIWVFLPAQSRQVTGSAVKQGQRHGLNSKEIDFRHWGDGGRDRR